MKTNSATAFMNFSDTSQFWQIEILLSSLRNWAWLHSERVTKTLRNFQRYIGFCLFSIQWVYMRFINKNMLCCMCRCIGSLSNSDCASKTGSFVHMELVCCLATESWNMPSPGNLVCCPLIRTSAPFSPIRTRIIKMSILWLKVWKMPFKNSGL